MPPYAMNTANVYIERTTGQKKIYCFFTEWDAHILLDTMQEMRKVNAYVRKHRKQLGATRLYSCHITIDDWADRSEVSKSPNSPLIKLWTQGRHSQCSCTCLTQKFWLLHSAIRINNHSLWIGRVTSSLEAKALAEEFGAAARNKQICLEMLKRATDPDLDFCTLYLATKFVFLIVIIVNSNWGIYRLRNQ